MRIANTIYVSNLIEKLHDSRKKHEGIFPKATLETQVKKFSEEFIEFNEAFDEGDLNKIFMEAADVLITLSGIMRFNEELAIVTAIGFIEGSGLEQYELFNIFDCVEKKWVVNVGRDWELIDGVYKHKGIDGNE